MEKKMSAKRKAKQLAKYLRGEDPNYSYMKKLFQYLREELEIKVETAPKKLPYVPTEEEIKKYYTVVCDIQHFQDMMIVKTLLYTGVRVSELVNIRVEAIHLKNCQIRINDGKGGKDRIVPFPSNFKELMTVHIQNVKKNGAAYLFESTWKKKYTDRGIRKLLQKYAEKAGLNHPVYPHMMRHFLFTWLKKQGIDNALIQPYSGHESRKSLEVYSKLSITEAQKEYDNVINNFPI